MNAICVILHVVHAYISLAYVQLAPLTRWYDGEKYGYKVSLLERLATAPGVSKHHNLMTEQYRMPAKLAEIVSDVFYDGRLTTPPAVAAARKHPAPVTFVDVCGHEEQQDKSFKNMAEVRAVVDIVRAETSDVGAGRGHSVSVITFYRPQISALERALREEGIGPEVEVKTIDTMQGREADVVVLSCVRSEGTLGHVAERTRVNVAISRAKQALYIVGHRASLAGGTRWGQPLWRQLLSHANVTHVSDLDELWVQSSIPAPELSESVPVYREFAWPRDVAWCDAFGRL